MSAVRLPESVVVRPTRLDASERGSVFCPSQSWIVSGVLFEEPGVKVGRAVAVAARKCGSSALEERLVCPRIVPREFTGKHLLVFGSSRDAEDPPAWRLPRFEAGPLGPFQQKFSQLLSPCVLPWLDSSPRPP